MIWQKNYFSVKFGDNQRGGFWDNAFLLRLCCHKDKISEFFGHYLYHRCETLLIGFNIDIVSDTKIKTYFCISVTGLLSESTE